MAGLLVRRVFGARCRGAGRGGAREHRRRIGRPHRRPSPCAV